MSLWYLPFSLSLLAVLAGCGSESQGNAASSASSTSESSVASKATIVAKPVAGFPDMAIPEVSGIDGAAARRINATLTAVRDRALRAATECRATARSSPFTYRLAAQPTYNDRGILSLRIMGEADCGGAHGATIAEAHTFNLASGEEVNVVEASGVAPAKLAALAAQGYEGDADCKTFLASGQASLGSAFVTERGVAVNFETDVGAGESCTANPGLAPWAALASTLKPPLAALSTSSR